MTLQIKQFCRTCGRLISDHKCQQCGVVAPQDVVSLAVEPRDRMNQLSDDERRELYATLKEIKAAWGRHRPAELG